MRLLGNGSLTALTWAGLTVVGTVVGFGLPLDPTPAPHIVTAREVAAVPTQPATTAAQPASARPAGSTVDAGALGGSSGPATGTRARAVVKGQQAVVRQPAPAQQPAGPVAPASAVTDAQLVTRSPSFAQPAGTASALSARVESHLSAVRAKEAAPLTFDLAEFNILGSNHTAPGSDADNFAPGRIRTEWAVGYVEKNGFDVVGFSEIQRDQLGWFLRGTRNGFAAWPGAALGGVGVPQTLVWRTSRFTALEKRWVTIPFMNQQRPQPVVLLQDKATGRKFWVMNAHNAPRDRVAERQTARAVELAMIQKLRASGVPVLFIGDMNEKEPIFCAVTGQTDLYSPLGGSNAGTCQPPRSMRVDWIFGSKDVKFAGFVEDRSSRVRAITDHAVLRTQVTIP